MAAVDTKYCVDVGHFQINKRNQLVCGDTFIYKWIKDEDRRILVLSDGLGSGIKANVLSSLTATMALNYTSGYRDVKISAETIMKALPVCSERKISYATFTIADIDPSGMVRIVNYDNPEPLIFRNGKPLDIDYSSINGKVKKRGYALRLASFQMRDGDRIVLFSDGISQAGMGSQAYPFGLGGENIGKYIADNLRENPGIQARALSRKVALKASRCDGGSAHDDITCAVIHFRKAKDLLIITGPPVEREMDSQLAAMADLFPGRKIVCGGTTAKILARELERKLVFSSLELFSSLPPSSSLEGFDLVTEGIITLHKVRELLQSGKTLENMPASPARDIVERILESDRVNFLTGTRINEAWQDPTLPDDIGLRRTIVVEIIKLLETLHNKEAKLTFV